MHWVFGAYALNDDVRELRRADAVVALEPKAFNVLVYLITHRDRAVSKSELLEALWPEEFVTETALTRSIRLIRQAIGDDGNRQQIVKTVRGYGYRFVAEVLTRSQRVVPHEHSPPTNPDTLPTQPHAEPPEAVSPLPPETVEVPMASAAAEPQHAERRQLTVMFCDLVDSTQLASQLDPEDWWTVVRLYQTASSEVIERFDGYVAQYLGGGIRLYFGYPMAHEDDAQRAVRTGLGIVEAMQTLNQQLARSHGIELAVHMGIHTGLVVLGDIVAGARQEQLALGETLNVAASLQGLAAPDMVVISEVTYRLVEGYFDCNVWGEHKLWGVSQPVTVYHVLKESGAQDRLDVGTRRGLTALVGRTSEVALLLDRWQLAKDGQGQVVLLSGEAGIGKSRLVQALRDHVADSPHTRLECRSSSYFTNSTLYPLIDMLQRMLRFQTDDTPEQKLEKLEANLSQYRQSLEEAVPLLASLLSLPVPDGRYPMLTLSPQRQRHQTLEVMVAIILELAERQPVLFVLEDLHWTDSTTLEFVELFLDQTPTASLCLLLTCRHEFQLSWSRRSYLTEVTVNRLSPSQIVQMVDQIAGDKPLPEDIVQQLVDKTDGVPLYVEEMTKAVLESGILKEVDGQYDVMGSLSLSIPSTLQDSLMARLDRLVTAKGVAQYAAVIGRQFSYELLRAASELDDMTLQRALERLVTAEIVYQRGVVPHSTYIFKHALIQNTAYASLLRSTRQQVHRRVALALEAQVSDSLEAYYGLLAHHYSVAEDVEKALHYHCCAADVSQRVYAAEETLEHYTQALDIVMAGQGGADAAFVSDLHIQRGQVYAQTGTIDRARADFEAALRVARAAGLQASEMQALYALGSYGWATDYQQAIPLFEAALPLAEALDDIDSQVRILSRMSIVYTNLLQLAQAFDQGRHALDLAQTLGDQRTQAMAMDSLAVAAAFIGDFTTLEEIGPQLIESHRHHGDLWYLQFALYQLCYVPIGRGRWDDAIAQLQEILAINRRIGDRGNESLYLSTLCWVHGSRGAYAHALENGRLAVSRSEALGNSELQGWNACCLGWVLLEVYALEEAVALLEQGRAAAEGAMALNFILRCTGPLAWAYWLLGDTERAQTLAVQAEAQCQQLTAPPDRAFLQGFHAYIAIAWVHLARGEAERAQQLLTPVLAAAETCGWQEAIAYGSLVVGHSLMARGAGELAEQALQRALQVTHDVSLPGVAWKAHAALADYDRGCQQMDTAAHHQAQAHTIIEQLATTLGDAAMQQRFLHAARAQLGEEG